MLQTGTIRGIIGNKRNEIQHLQTKNSVSISTIKQTEENKKLTVKKPIPNIYEIDEINFYVWTKLRLD